MHDAATRTDRVGYVWEVFLSSCFLERNSWLRRWFAVPLGPVHRAKRLTGLWPYLPTFRFVAEHQHVSQAAAELGLTPSAVSRSVALLERGLQKKLFVRSGRRMELNADGARLLNAVRVAMRHIDDGLVDLAEQGFSGPLRIRADEPFRSLFLAAWMGRLLRDAPRLLPTLVDATGTASSALLSGTVDIVFQVEGVTRRAELACVALDSVTLVKAVPAGLSNAAVQRLRSAQVGPAASEPAAACVVQDYATALSLVAAGSATALVPSTLPLPSGITALPETKHTVKIHAVTRASLGEDGPVVQALALARAVIAEKNDL